MGNSKSKQFASTQQQSSGFVQRRLGYIFISNGLQEFLSTADILIPISTNLFPDLFSLSANIGGKDFWKLNRFFNNNQT